MPVMTGDPVPETVVAVVLMLALTAYAVLAGADFGGGVWDLLARGPRAEAQRQAIARAMGPVWEANHVWLIFALVLLFTAFPRAYSSLGVALFVPFHLVLAGIVLRGAAFVFRAPAATASGPQRAWASVFGAASTITPFLLGATLAAVSSGGIRVADDGAVTVNAVYAWFSPFSLLVGALTVALFAYLAAVYLAVETGGELQEDFRRRALGAGVAVAVLAAVLLPLAPRTAPHLWELVSARGRLLVATGAVLAILSGWLVWQRRFLLARVAAVAEVVVLLWGWALGQWPYLIYPDVTVFNAAAPDPILRFALWATPVGLLILIPSLWLLFAVFKGENPQAGEPAGALDPRPGRVVGALEPRPGRAAAAPERGRVAPAEAPDAGGAPRLTAAWWSRRLRSSRRLPDRP
ncbi:cytochrome bd quinol oxidase subunit 2 apoprotein [Thermaerobacter marianensis DSM 12885]|uniref:Cytochrome bd quinol oxidase subunit 2 apoprotein n=1 Tax=Thermaerobacter marianensis (strain ATCC 700841 / DSM 12885 / JCM 10246 / 7p75a) TaxID=644966 RepID=E6SI74_THEM7|nr:cytochrome bd quinol oxidase subunit 2 apoprotein [Thermaerobacter marianensis DSM 12885]